MGSDPELSLSAKILYRWKREFETDPDQSFPGNARLADHDKQLEEELDSDWRPAWIQGLME